MYEKPIAEVQSIAAACADLLGVFERAKQVKPASASDPAGQDDADLQAKEEIAAAEKRARGIFGDIVAHAQSALGAEWGDVAPAQPTPPEVVAAPMPAEPSAP